MMTLQISCVVKLTTYAQNQYSYFNFAQQPAKTSGIAENRRGKAESCAAFSPILPMPERSPLPAPLAGRRGCWDGRGCERLKQGVFELFFRRGAPASWNLNHTPRPATPSSINLSSPPTHPISNLYHHPILELGPTPNLTLVRRCKDFAGRDTIFTNQADIYGIFSHTFYCPHSSLSVYFAHHNYFIYPS